MNKCIVCGSDAEGEWGDDGYGFGLYYINCSKDEGVGVSNG